MRSRKRASVRNASDSTIPLASVAERGALHGSAASQATESTAASAAKRS